MITVAFVLFAILLAGWLVAPGGQEKKSAAPAPAATLQLGEVVA
jgi:hypothetical protein